MADAITKIAVSGFKSIKKEQSIEVRPLTILAGANNSGKSSIMQPLLLMKQTLEQTFDPGPLWLGGPNVRFSKAEGMLARGADSFCVRIEAGSENWHRVCFKQVGMGVDVAEVEFQYPDLDKPIRLRLDMTPQEIRSVQETLAPMAADGSSWRVKRGRCSLIMVERSQDSSAERTSIAGVRPQIHRVIHLPGLRGNRERTFKATGIGKTFPGTFENYTASVILFWQEGGEKQKRGLLEGALRKLGLPSKIVAKRVSATEISTLVGRLLNGAEGGSNDLVDISDVGFGVLMVLPVLVALIVAKDGDLVYLEEPEIHLHPNAEFHMAALLADAAKRGVRVVAETHSSILLRGIQTLVARGELSPDLVKLHWFTRDDEGFTQIHPADLDENGAFDADWPSDFDEIELHAQGEFIDAAMEAQRARK